MSKSAIVTEEFQRAANVLNCSTEDLKGMTLEGGFNECSDCSGVTIAWGSWTEEQLNTVL